MTITGTYTTDTIRRTCTTVASEHIVPHRCDYISMLLHSTSLYYILGTTAPQNRAALTTTEVQRQTSKHD